MSKRYEYRNVSDADADDLNEYGAKGWMVVAAIRATDHPHDWQLWDCLLMRPIPCLHRRKTIAEKIDDPARAAALDALR